MNVAVFSDIHSNFHAFLACYKDAVKCGADIFIFLGDYISDLADPQQTMDLVYEIQEKYSTFCLRGNREKYMLDADDGIIHFTRGSKSGSLLFTYDHLRQKDLDFFRDCRISDILEINGVYIEIAHATADDDRFYFDDDDGKTNIIFPQMKCNYLLTGHSHRQYIKKCKNKTIINPGSVGVPQGGSRWPKYAILKVESGNVSCEFREVPYDMENTIHAQFAKGLMDYAKYWAIGVLYDMVTGEEWVLKLLKQVESFGNVHDEKAWHNAAVQLGMHLTEAKIIGFYREIATSLRSSQ